MTRLPGRAAAARAEAAGPVTTRLGPFGAPRAWTPPLLTLILFAALAVWLFARTLINVPGAWIGDDRDPHLFIWYLGWTPHQLASLRSPLFTTHLQYPDGANLMWNTAVFAPAVLVWPLTAVFGPVVAYNVTATAAVALSAWCAYWAARRFVSSDVLAAGVGLLYGFSPYMVAQSMRHLHVTLALFPPVALILLHEILIRQRRSPFALGSLLGLAAAVQLLTSEEILAITALAALGGTALLVLLHPREVAARAPRSLTALATAAGCFAVLAAYPLAFQFFGPQRVSGILQPPNTYVSDLLAFVVPPSPMALSSNASVAVTGRFTGNVTENDAYVGIPLILLFGAATALRWRRPLVRWAAPLTAALAVLSLGPRLHVGGHVAAFPLPWALVGRLPLLESVVPARLMLLVFLGIGLVVADLLGAAPGAGSRRRALAAAAVAAALIPLAPRWPYASTPAQAPAFFEPGGGVTRVPAGSVVLVTPFSNHLSSVAMFWQAAAGYTFRMPEGEAFVPGPSLGPPPSHLQDTFSALDRGDPVPMSADDCARTRRELAALEVGTVIAGPSPGHDRIVRYVTDVLNRPPIRSGGVDVWWNVRAGSL